MALSINRIGFISTRIAGTDGVSLEIDKWAQVLTRNGFECFYFAGELDRDAKRCYFVEDAHFEHPAIQEISGQLFGVTVRSREVSEKIQTIKEKLKNHLYRFWEQFSLDLIIPENSLTIPMNIPLGLALTEFIAETGIPTIAHHHDFYWERDRFLINACQDYLNQAFPAELPSMQHVVINSLAAQQLSHRLGISNTLIPNVYDFAHEPPPSRVDARKLKKEIGLKEDDLLILQPTRVVPRKWIERSIEIVHSLKLQNPALVISHKSGDEGDDYYNRVSDYARNMNVKLLFIGELISNTKGGKKARYNIGDIYQCADLVTYPSGYEGFGNAFLETIYYKKPIVVNRYSIYIADIEPKNFQVITIDGFVTEKTINQIRRVLSDAEYRENMVNRNYELAAKYFSYEILERKLLHLISNAQMI
ncbi:MAG: glycosyltransferase family 4 protein [Calditrichia bacterium]